MILMAFMVAEKTDVHIPVGVFVDGFFVTHTRTNVNLFPEDCKLPTYNPYDSPVPVMDMENVPIRQMRDPFVMKSNFISYAAHASWQQEVDAAMERSRKYLLHYLGGLIETEHEDADILVVASGTAVSQSREAIRVARDEGIHVGLIKIKSIRPFPREELRALTSRAQAVVVPEFNRTGWLARELCNVINEPRKVVQGPRVFGGMTMPPELILEEIRRSTR